MGIAILCIYKINSTESIKNDNMTNLSQGETNVKY